MTSFLDLDGALIFCWKNVRIQEYAIFRLLSFLQLG